jgi:hypothetical protein
MRFWRYLAAWVILSGIATGAFSSLGVNAGPNWSSLAGGVVGTMCTLFIMGLRMKNWK